MNSEYTNIGNYYRGQDSELDSGDIEIINQFKNKKNKKQTKKRSNVNYNNSNWIESDDNDWMDEDDDIDPDENDKLLKEPLTRQERTMYTRDGISVIVEFGRSKAPAVTINIACWDTSSILNAFDKTLRRFGFSHSDYVCTLEWKGQTHPYCIDWQDLGSLNIPWDRDNFEIKLRRRGRKRGRDNNDNDNDNKKKKRKKMSKNALKNMENRAGVRKVIDLLDDEYVKWIRNYKGRQHLLKRLTHLHLSSTADNPWGREELQNLIYDNYMAFDVKRKIEAAQKGSSDLDLRPKEINQITKDIYNTSTSNTTQHTDLGGMATNKAMETSYWKTVFDKNIDRTIDSKLLTDDIYNNNDDHNHNSKQIMASKLLTDDIYNNNNGHNHNSEQIMASNNNNITSLQENMAKILQENKQLKAENQRILSMVETLCKKQEKESIKKKETDKGDTKDNDKMEAD